MLATTPSPVTTALAAPTSRRRAIVAFYASLQHGSEYRAGAEFVRFASSAGFDLAVIADLQQNALPAELSAAAGGISVCQVPSPVVKQNWLYRFTDFLPQVIWHRRVARFLKNHHPELDAVWVQNGALPWLPVSPYEGVAPLFIWGPIGGGEILTGKILDTLGTKTRWREKLRSGLEGISVWRKKSLFAGSGFSKIVPLARTAGAQRQLRKLFVSHDVPVIPEILDPIPAIHLDREQRQTPRFVWVGQDIPRKNLPLALELFRRIRAEKFPDATLDVYGVPPNPSNTVANVTFHGWVSSIDWKSYRHDGVLLLTSYREGLPSVVLEAIREGLLCITSDVGSLASLGVPTIHVLPTQEYPDYSLNTFSALISRLETHLSSKHVEISPVSYREGLLAHLRKNQA